MLRKEQAEALDLNDYDAEIWKKTSFFTTGKHVELFIELQEHLEALGIAGSVSDSSFKIKFDTTPMQTKKIYALYVHKLKEIQEKKPEIMTQQQQALMAKQEVQDILNGTAQEEETKEEPASA